jgi:hypothetical protein
VSDIDIAVADSLKVLDLKRPIREADVEIALSNVSYGPISEVRRILFLGPRKAPKTASRRSLQVQPVF